MIRRNILITEDIQNQIRLYNGPGRFVLLTLSRHVPDLGFVTNRLFFSAYGRGTAKRNRIYCNSLPEHLAFPLTSSKTCKEVMDLVDSQLKKR